ECRGIFLHHPLRQDRTRGTHFFRRLPRPAIKRSVNFFKRSRAIRRCSRLLRLRKHFAISSRLPLRLLHSVPQLPRLRTHARIAHLLCKPSRRLRGSVPRAPCPIFSGIARSRGETVFSIATRLIFLGRLDLRARRVVRG